MRVVALQRVFLTWSAATVITVGEKTVLLARMILNIRHVVVRVLLL